MSGEVEPVPPVQVAAMVVHLGRFARNPLHPSIQDHGQQTGVDEVGHYYRCSNLSPEGDCTIYETRPRMCSEYPEYHGTCGYAQCTRRLDHQLVHVPAGILVVDKVVVETIDILSLARTLDERAAVVGRMGAVNEVREALGMSPVALSAPKR